MEMSFLDYFRKICFEKRYSVRRLALKAEVCQSYIAKIASGDRNIPSDKILFKIAEVLEVDPDEFFIRAGKLPNTLKELLITGRISEKRIQILLKACKGIPQELSINGKISNEDILQLLKTCKKITQKYNVKI